MSNKFVIKNDISLSAVVKFLYSLDLSVEWSIDVKEYNKKRSLSQNSTFHGWTGEISKFLIEKGKKDWTPEFTKSSLKHTFLGYEDKIRTDMVTGVQRVTSELKKTSDLDTGEMYYFMQQVESWATNIGCMVTIPNSGEYFKNKQREIS